VQGEDVEGSLPRGSIFGRGKVARFLRSETFHCGCYCHDLFTWYEITLWRWCAYSRECLRRFNIINSACFPLYQNVVANCCATRAVQPRFSTVQPLRNLIFMMFLPPTVSQSTSARGKGSQRPRQGNAKQKRQAESAPGPGGARPHCALMINLAWPSMELKRITPMRKGRMSLCHKHTRHKLSPVQYRLWENAAWRSGCGLFLLCPASEELSPPGAQTQSTSSPPFIQLKLSHYQCPHTTSPGFSAQSNLVPSCTKRRRYIPTQHFRSQMPRGGSKTILHGFPKHLTYSKLSTCYHHQSLENDHAWPSISISETSQGILSLFLGRPQPFIFKPPRCAKSSGNRRFLLL